MKNQYYTATLVALLWVTHIGIIYCLTNIALEQGWL
jgi:hypothetical protein